MSNYSSELADLGAEVAERHKIDQDFFVRELLKNHEAAFDGTPVLSRNGDQVMRNDQPLMKRDIGGSNRALELLGRFTGELVEKREVATRSLDSMSEDELREEQAKTRAEIVKLKTVK